MRKTPITLGAGTAAALAATLIFPAAKCGQ